MEKKWPGKQVEQAKHKLTTTPEAKATREKGAIESEMATNLVCCYRNKRNVQKLGHGHWEERRRMKQKKKEMLSKSKHFWT